MHPKSNQYIDIAWAHSMAQEQYLLPNRWVKKLPILRKIVWPLEAVLLRLLLWTMHSLSVQRAYNVAVRFCRVIEPLAPFTTKFSNNLMVAFPEKTTQEIEQLARLGCANIGKAVADLVLAKRIWGERDKRIEFVTHHGVDELLNSGGPVVFITAHVGAWQLTSFVTAKYQLPMTSVYAPESNPFLHQLVNGLRTALHCRFILKKGCMRVLMTTLKQGGSIGFVPDLRLDGGERIPFFGIDAPSNTTAARMALHHGCELLPIRAERLPDCRFRITIFPPIHADDPNAPIAIQAKQMTQKQLALFESWVRETPDQWLCVGPRWGQEAYTPEAHAVAAARELELLG